MAGEKQQFDRAFCESIVGAYLAGQGWLLVDPAEMADAIWREVEGAGQQEGQQAGQLASQQAGQLASQQTKVRTAVWERYAALLHDSCRRPGSERHDAAWSELRAWLARQAPRVNDDPRDQEEIVQEALIDLKHKLDEKPLQAPRALWAYALATLKRKEIDRHRRRTAEKRGEGEVGSLEGLAAAYREEGPGTWEERVQAAGQGSRERATERAVADREVREQLKALFERLFSSSLQLWVAEAHFLDGLRPAEIAGLAGKTPHEIRMVKARAVRKLRSLPAAERQRLLALLAGGEEEV